jgi:chromate transporter
MNNSAERVSPSADPPPPAVQKVTPVRLFIAFLRLGATAFGGPAMIAYIRKMAVERNRWLDGQSFQSGAALCQTIPGATSMQMAAYVGLKARGVRGAAASYLGFGLPAFLLMLGLSAVYSRVHNVPAVVSAFSGLQAVIVAVVANAALAFGRTSVKGWKYIGIALAAAGLFGLMVNPVIIILLAALLGMALNRAKPADPGTAPPFAMPNTTTPLIFLMSVTASGFVLLYTVRRDLFPLAVLMSRIDLSAFGGGFASVPLMFHEIVGVHAWMDASTFLDGIALGQFTPGPIVITATFVGWRLYGLAGALAASAAIFTPSFLILIGVAPYFDRLRALPRFAGAIDGILCSFVGLLLIVTIRFAGHVHWDWAHLLLALAALGALIRRVDLHWVVLAGAAVSVFLF